MVHADILPNAVFIALALVAWWAIDWQRRRKGK